METIKGAVDTASKVLFGDQTAQQQGTTGTTGNTSQSGLEPQSGVTGNTRAGEPYDGGNIDERGVGGVAGGRGYTKEDDAHAFKTAHEIPRGDDNTGSGLTGSSNTSSGLTGTGSGVTGGSNAGPHHSNAANILDPRVDSDRDGRSGLTGSSNTSSGLAGTGSGFTGGSSNTASHDSNAANKLDPRVDSDRDGRSGVSGSNTQSQGGIGETLSKAAAAVTGGSVGGASAQHDKRGTTSGNNSNLREYSMKDATDHATSQRQVGQPGIADTEHRDDTHKHQGANDPLDQPGHRDTHAIRDTKNEAERRLDPSTDASGSHGSESSSAAVGQNPDSVRHGSLTGHLPGAPGGEGLQKTSTGEGTGKEYVKSTGLQAEGGDFDASRPGAGKEADRLLEERGIHHGEEKTAHKGHGHDEASSKMAGGHSTTGTHSHGAHTGTPGTLGAHDDKRDVETASTTAIRDGVPGQTPSTHAKPAGASTSHGTHTGATTGAHDTTGKSSTTTGHSSTGTHSGTHDDKADKPSLKEKIKDKLHMH